MREKCIFIPFLAFFLEAYISTCSAMYIMLLFDKLHTLEEYVVTFKNVHRSSLV